VEKRKFKLVIAYDGTNYEGWQVQKTGTGVQQIVERALAKLFPSGPRLHSSSRTDTGVHALGMVAHFEVPCGGDAPVAASRPGDEASPPPAGFKMSTRKLALALNAWLPEDIRILSAARAPGNFHARFDATGKQYRYFVWNHTAMNPLLRYTAWHVTRPLDLKAMRAAAPRFIGRHDFKSFAGTRGNKVGVQASACQATGGTLKRELQRTVRTLTRCDIKKSGRLLTFIIEGDGFLYKMCRGIVGTLVQIGLGKFPPGEARRMLAKKDRRVAGMTAPAQGLVLWKVFYKQSVVRSQ